MLSFHSKRERREAVIRSNLLERLKESVQSLIYGPGGENVPKLSSSIPKGQVLGHTDNTNALCCVLEAIFIHGLKDSLGERLSSMFLGDLDRMPVPNFWMVLMVISHRDLIEQVSSLSFIMSDVGKARAWMRLALNQGQLISYFSVLASDTQTLKDYYRPTALLRDIESCDIMLRILHPLAGISFNLATNAAILNTWTQTPLILSGVWIPAKYEESIGPVLSATDVASTFDDDTPHDTGLAIHQTPLSDQMFDLIIGRTPETTFINETLEGLESNDNFKGLQSDDASPEKQTEKAVKPKINKVKNERHIMPDSQRIDPFSSATAISSGTTATASPRSTATHLLSDDATAGGADEDDHHFPRCRRLSSTTTVSERDSVMNRSVSVISDTNEYRSLLLDWETSDTGENLPSFLASGFAPFQLAQNILESVSNEKTEEDNDFEFLSSKLPSEEEMSAFLPMLTTLMNEKGLDFQNYHCYSPSCNVPIGMIYGKPRLCKYDGKYYCFACHQGDMSIIPARVIHNWDFTPYPVCTANKKWLDMVMLHPLLNIRLVNPKLYQHIEDLWELQMLRIQLHFIQAYLFTCNYDKGTELRKMFWPREHLYEHVHLYSVYDLKQVFEGKLVPMARQAVTNGKCHILKCQVCSPRGFICEVCKKSQIIYPFQLDNAFNCSLCTGVFHKTCVKIQQDCPRCKRLELRRLNSSDDAVVTTEEICDNF